MHAYMNEDELQVPRTTVEWSAIRLLRRYISALRCMLGLERLSSNRFQVDINRDSRPAVFRNSRSVHDERLGGTMSVWESKL